MVDDLAHEIREEDGLGDDGEPREQVADAQTQQLGWHLEHGEPQQPDGGLHLADNMRRHASKPDGCTAGTKSFWVPHLSLFALRVPAGGGGVSAAVSAPLPAAPPMSGLHVVEVVHAARGLDEQGGVGAAVAVAVAPHSAVVGEGAGRLAVEGVAVAGVPDGGSCTGSWKRREQVRKASI